MTPLPGANAGRPGAFLAMKGTRTLLMTCTLAMACAALAATPAMAADGTASGAAGAGAGAPPAAPREITPSQHLLPLIAAVLVAGVTIELIRRRKLREEYAMLWIGASVVLLVFAAVPQLLLLIQKQLGVFYLTIVLILSFSFLALVALHLAVIVTRLSEGGRQLTQRVALLERRIEELEGPAEPGPSQSPDDRPTV